MGFEDQVRRIAQEEAQKVSGVGRLKSEQHVENFIRERLRLPENLQAMLNGGLLRNLTDLALFDLLGAIDANVGNVGNGATVGPTSAIVTDLSTYSSVIPLGALSGAFAEQCSWTWGMPGGDQIDFYVKNNGPNNATGIHWHGFIAARR